MLDEARVTFDAPDVTLLQSLTRKALMNIALRSGIQFKQQVKHAQIVTIVHEYFDDILHENEVVVSDKYQPLLKTQFSKADLVFKAITLGIHFIKVYHNGYWKRKQTKDWSIDVIVTAIFKKEAEITKSFEDDDAPTELCGLDVPLPTVSQDDLELMNQIKISIENDSKHPLLSQALLGKDNKIQRFRLKMTMKMMMTMTTMTLS
jgi:hypothetical protein